VGDRFVLQRAAQAVVMLSAVALLGLVARHAVFLFIEAEAFIAPPAGPLIPDALGVPSQQLSFASGDRILRASHVPAGAPDAPAMAIFHGDEEEISRWAAVQVRLHSAGVASFVFDYSGYGASTGKPSVARLRQDALVAYERYVALTPNASRRLALGFSLGSAVLIDVADQLQPPPDGIVIAAGFASAREMAVATGLIPGWAAWVLPDLWNNEKRLPGISLPLLIVHSRSDEVIPFEHALRLCRAAQGPGRMVPLEGIAHDAPLDPGAAGPFWDVVIEGARSSNFGAATAGSRACP
jgi:alpha-beta hydrolase superfamily lysophospholipase